MDKQQQPVSSSETNSEPNSHNNSSPSSSSHDSSSSSNIVHSSMMMMMTTTQQQQQQQAASHTFVDLAQVTSEALVEQLTSAAGHRHDLQQQQAIPTASDSSVLISSSSDFNQYRDVDVQSLASSRRTDVSNASTARSQNNLNAAGRGMTMMKHITEEVQGGEHQVDNVMATSSDESSANNASGSTTQTSAPHMHHHHTGANQAADNEIANITDIWIQEDQENQEVDEELEEPDDHDQANASPVFSNEDDSNSNQLDDASLQNNPHSQDHFSLNSLNEESYAESSNQSPSSGQQTRSHGSPQHVVVSQTLPQSTLTPMPLTGDNQQQQQLSSQQPPASAATTTSTSTSTITTDSPATATTTSTTTSTTSSSLNDTSVRTSSLLISNNNNNNTHNANETTTTTGSSNSISHYSIFTRIRSQPSTSQTASNTLNHPTPTPTSSTSQPSQSSSSSKKSSSLVSSSNSNSNSTKQHSTKQSTFKFEPKSPSFHKLIEDYYKDFAEETDQPLTHKSSSSTLKDAAGFSSINENYLAFYKLSKLFLRHENYYCTMFLPFNRVYKYKNQDEVSISDYLALESSTDEHHHHYRQQQQQQRKGDHHHHHHNSKLLNSLVDKFKSDEANNSAKQPSKTAPLNQDDFEEMIAAVTGVNNNRSKQQNENSSNSSSSSCRTQSQQTVSGSNMQPLPEDQYDLFGERKSANSSQTSSMLQKSSEFFTCSLCSHYLYEPITLVCGCSFCRNCLIEYNKTLERMKYRETVVEMRQRKTKRSSTVDSASSTSEQQQPSIADQDGDNEEPVAEDLSATTGGELSSDPSDDEEEKLVKMISEKNLFPKYSQRQNKVILYQCYNCGKTHDQNTSDHLKINVFISKLVDRLWAKSVDARQLRIDIRHFICYEMELFDKFNLHKYEYLLKQVYEMDKSNHLILADLFMINYFSGCLENCLKYANLMVQLRPNWPFSYYMRAIYYRKMNDIYRLKSNLILCLHLDPSIEQIRVELFQTLMLTNHNLLSDSPSPAMTTLGKKSSRGAGHLLSGKSSTAIISEQPEEDIYDYNTAQSKSVSCAPIKRARSFNCDNSQGESTSMSKHQKFNATPPKDSFLDSNSNDNSMNSYQEEEDETDKASSSDNNHRSYSASKQSSSSSSYSPPQQRMRSTLTTISQDSQGGSPSSNQDQQQKAAEADNSRYLSLNSSLIKIADLECSLCYRLILNPVTTPCGHSFCCSCLDRSLDHQDKCPLCKHSLADYLAERRSSTTSFIEKLIRLHFPNEFEERKKQHEEELKDLSSDDELPIFVCTLALPNAPCPLHIYEPRYRLMLRRAIETGSRQFGMCMYSERTEHKYTEYGCVLKIQNFQFSRDGRAIVHSIGGKRFKVVKSSSKDGYNVAQVEWVKDERAVSAQDLSELQQIHDEVYQLSLTWYSFIPSIQKNKILEIYGMGEIPAPDEDIQADDNGPAWHWFVLSILPLENDFQYKFLTKTSLKERLKQMKKIISILLRPFDRGSSSMPSSLSNSTNNLATSGSQPEELTAGGQSSSARSSPNHQT